MAGHIYINGLDFLLNGLTNITALSPDDPTDCIVCHNRYTFPVRTPCGHLFCRPCLRQWLVQERKDTCVTCRRKFFFAFSDDERQRDQEILAVVTEIMSSEGGYPGYAGEGVDPAAYCFAVPPTQMFALTEAMLLTGTFLRISRAHHQHDTQGIIRNRENLMMVLRGGANFIVLLADVQNRTYSEDDVAILDELIHQVGQFLRTYEGDEIDPRDFGNAVRRYIWGRQDNWRTRESAFLRESEDLQTRYQDFEAVLRQMAQMCMYEWRREQAGILRERRRREAQEEEAEAPENVDEEMNDDEGEVV